MIGVGEQLTLTRHRNTNNFPRKNHSHVGLFLTWQIIDIFFVHNTTLKKYLVCTKIDIDNHLRQQKKNIYKMNRNMLQE